jgi:parallel beta-helix repeat protein
MSKKSVYAVTATLFLLSILTLKVDVQLARAGSTWTVDDDGPADFHAVQDAINAAIDGDSIYVYNGIYYEHLVIDKSTVLLGESKRNTIIDGRGENRTVIDVTTSNVAISRFTIQNSSRTPGTSYAGIKISGLRCNLTCNHITRNKIGILVTSQKSRIAENNITNNGHGISLYYSHEITVEANNLSANTVGISLAYSFNNMIVDNRVANSSTGGHGITLSSNSFNNTISNNDLTHNYHGIWLSNSFNNSIFENTIAHNELLGIELASSPNNTFYHNIFINNPKHVVSDNQANTWDDGYPSGGNYWSDYKERYLNATELDNSGIWDTPYVINENNQDNYPLILEFPSIIILLLFLIATLLTVIVYRKKH